MEAAREQVEAAVAEFRRRLRAREDLDLNRFLADQSPELRVEVGRACLSIDLFSPSVPDSGLGPGTVVGDFLLREPLGLGGMASVYHAEDRRLGREVALKFLHPALAGAGSGHERFEREAAALAALNHPAIVPVHRIGSHMGVPYFVMEYVRGRSLRERLAAEDPLGVVEVVSILVAVARGLHHAHELGFVHRDVKPENILLQEDGTPRLADFGICKTLEDDGPTLTGSLIGTPEYMSPEQLRGEPEAIDRRTDVYALGAVLYELLTGQRPFQGTPSQVMAQALERDPPAVRERNPSVPRDLETICLKAMEREPGGRYPTAAAMANDLQRFSRFEPIAAARPSPLARLWKLVRREPARAALWMVLLVGLPATLTAGMWANGWIARAEAARVEGVVRDVEQAWEHLTLAEIFHVQGRRNPGLSGSVLGLDRLTAEGERLFERALARARPVDGIDVEATCGLALARLRSGRDALLPEEIPGAREELRTVFAGVRRSVEGGARGHRPPEEAAFLDLLRALSIDGDAPAEDLERRVNLLESAVWSLPAPRSFFHYQLGSALASVGEGEGAVRMAQVIESRWPSSGEAWFLAGMLYDSGDPEAAARSYERAIELAPELAFIGHNQLAYRALERGDSSRHLHHLRLAVELEENPWRATHLYDLGVTQAGSEPSEAERAYRACLELQPTNYRAALNLAALVERDGREQEMFELLALAAEHAPPGRDAGVVLSALGATYLDRGEPGEAIACLRRGTAEVPDNAWLWFHLTRAHLADGDPASAEQAFDRVMRSCLDPEYLQGLGEQLERARSAASGGDR